MATFSVIVPVHNAAHTIERCVNSLLACGSSVQVILVEDCSRDNSWEVCQRLAERHENVVCARNEENRGVSYTRNRGLALAEGEYLLFADSDDWVDPAFVSAFDQAAQSGARLAICGYVKHDEKQSGRTDIYVRQDIEGTKEVALREELKKLYDECLLQQVWNKVFLNVIVQEKGIRFDESISIGEDTRFVLDYIAIAGLEKTVLINQPLYHYMRDQAGSLMFRVGNESVDEPLKNLRKIYEIMGLPRQELEQRLVDDRRKQVELYAYLIMHNMGMPMLQRRKLTLQLDAQDGKKLWQKNLVLIAKEKISNILKS